MFDVVFCFFFIDPWKLLPQGPKTLKTMKAEAEAVKSQFEWQTIFEENKISTVFQFKIGRIPFRQMDTTE